MIDGGRFPVLGVGIDAVDYEEAVRRILEAAREGRPFGVTALAVHGVMTGFDDAVQLERLRSLDLVVPDGQPVRWALQWLHGVRLEDRVYGPELMLRVCGAAAESGLPVYLYGSTAEVSSRLAERLQTAFPTLTLAGRRESLFRRTTATEAAEICAEIRSSGARVVFVGLGCPRQETWVYENRDALGVPAIAVGAAFDFHTGDLPQAPSLLQDHGLEWLYRLLREPRRLWRRYLLLNPRYVWGLLQERMGRVRSVDVPEHVPREGFA